MKNLQNNKNTIGVLFGGRSSEHEISLRSAVYILKSIPQDYKIIPIGIDRQGVFSSLVGNFHASDFDSVTTDDLSLIVQGKVPKNMRNAKNEKSIFLPIRRDTIADNYQIQGSRVLNLELDCVFPVLHGQNGEDGRLQGLLELAEIAYVGSDLRGTAVGIDKDIQKRLARESGIAVAKYEVIEHDEFDSDFENVAARVKSKIGFPCFVKPNSCGSAVGTNKVTSMEALNDALAEAFAFDEKVLVEELLVGSEVECSYLGTPYNPRITVPGEIVNENFYSYEEKYSQDSKAVLYIPARLPQAKIEEVQSLARRVVRATGITGFARVDFWFIPKTNAFIFNEVNTIPGLTSISMFPKLWEHEGVAGKTWVGELIDVAYKRALVQSKAQFGIKAC